ncbi:LysR family transcriptional regulator [Nocardioides caricicola]|uniref:LysR family transcriptional regulator n=1 Tax=Nocardioides caricicola TaxID=634770 RepID=A0ABW0N2G0_9ACTN
MATISAWRTYVEVCRLGSFSAAGAALGYSQSAISRQLAGLERDLGVALLERRPRGVRPTAAGRDVLRHAQTMVHAEAQARRAASDARDRRRLSVGAVPSASGWLLPEAFRAIRADHPEVLLTLRTAGSTELEDGVEAGVLDLAVVSDYPPGLPVRPGIDRTVLLRDPMSVILPADHHLAATADPLGLGVLRDETWVEDNAGSAAVLQQAAAAAGFTPRIDLEAGDLLGKVALVAAGHAIALVPGLLVAALPPGVAVRRIADGPTRVVYASRVRRPDPDAALDDLVSACRRVAGQMSD